jgi:hypothetical protein
MMPYLIKIAKINILNGYRVAMLLTRILIQERSKGNNICCGSAVRREFRRAFAPYGAPKDLF